MAVARRFKSNTIPIRIKEAGFHSLNGMSKSTGKTRPAITRVMSGERKLIEMAKLGTPLVKIVVNGFNDFGNYKQEYIIAINTDGDILRKESYKGHPNKGPYDRVFRGRVKPDILVDWKADPQKAITWLKENVIGRLKVSKDYGTCANCQQPVSYSDKNSRLVAFVPGSDEWICKTCFENVLPEAEQRIKYEYVSTLLPKSQTEAEKDVPQFKTLSEKIQWESAQRRERYAQFAEWVKEAKAAGEKARNECIPTPMFVQERANPLDDNSPVIKRYAPVMQGVFGNAWVTINPANSSFAIWARKNAGFRSGSAVCIMGRCYLYLSIGSMEKQEAYARAYANVLRNHGIEAFSGSRMD